MRILNLSRKIYLDTFCLILFNIIMFGPNLNVFAQNKTQNCSFVADCKELKEHLVKDIDKSINPCEISIFLKKT